MFGWFKRKPNIIDIIRCLKNVNINVRVSGTINVKERRDTLEKECRSQAAIPKTEQSKPSDENTITSEPDFIPD